MRRASSGLLLASSFVMTVACTSAPSTGEGAQPSAPAAATAAPAAASSTLAAEPSPAAAPAKAKVETPCPLPRRCDEACKDTNWKALDACKAEGQAMMQALPNAQQLGTCAAACLKTPNPNGCVGAANETECACTLKCKDAIPPALLDKEEVYEACYRKQLEGTCF